MAELFSIGAIRKAAHEASPLREDPQRKADLQKFYDALSNALNEVNPGYEGDGLALGEAIAVVLGQVIEKMRPIDRRKLLKFIATRGEAIAQGRNLKSGAGIAVPVGASEN